MNLLHQARKKIDNNPEYWSLHLMDFVDDFRRHKNVKALNTPFTLTNPGLSLVWRV